MEYLHDDTKNKLPTPTSNTLNKLAALISTLTDALLLTRAAISHSGTETERCDCKACATVKLRGADFAAVPTQASVANPLYSSINPHGCAHPVRTPVWTCQHSPAEPQAELCRPYEHRPHYAHNQILLISSERPQRLL